MTTICSNVHRHRRTIYILIWIFTCMIQPSTLDNLLEDQALFDGELVKNVGEIVGISGGALLEERDEMALERG